MREVTVWQAESVYRARVERVTKGIFRKREGWRYVIEWCWSRRHAMRMPTDPEDWKRHKVGPWVNTRTEAEVGAEAWLDEAEALNPDDEDYV